MHILASILADPNSRGCGVQDICIVKKNGEFVDIFSSVDLQDRQWIDYARSSTLTDNLN